MRFVTPDEFASYATVGAAKGFLLVSSTPLTRSSHHAGEDFARLRAARLAQAAALSGSGLTGSGSPRPVLLTLPDQGCRHNPP